MKIKKLLATFAAVTLLLHAFPNLLGESHMDPTESISLPKSINGWNLADPPRRIDETNIFEYMNGAGELYLGYHFDHLTVYEYQNRDQDTIAVELYQMEESRDALGLLSMDWSGEPVELGDLPRKDYPTEIVPPCRALYGKGLLRAWSDNLYLRIMANRETPEVREVILKLGQAITAGRGNPAPPDFLKIINSNTDSSWKATPERTAYFYSHLVLNSFFYISHENILNLTSSTEAMMLTFKREILSLDRENPGEENRTAHLLVIRYSDFKESSRALSDLLESYLPELVLRKIPEEGRENRAFIKIEDGWMGYRLLDRHLALALACPDQPSAFKILSQAELK